MFVNVIFFIAVGNGSFTLSAKWGCKQLTLTLVFYGTFSTNRLFHAIEVGNVSHRPGENTDIMQ